MRARSTLIVAALLACGCNPRGMMTNDAGSGMDTGPRPDSGPCTTPVPEGDMAACSDGADNDCDGHVDCDDYGCCPFVSCGPDTACGDRDAGIPMGEACEGSSVPENTPERCMDGCSNDHADDRYVDCEDRDCCAHRSDCGPTTECGRRGPPARACEDSPIAENTLARCMDGCSNDHDNDDYVDCNELDCCWVRHTAEERGLAPACGDQTYCATSWTPPTGAVLCEDLSIGRRPENSFERCSDGCDNDRNFYQDCREYDCCAIIERAVARGVEGATACGGTTECAVSSTPRDPLCDDDDGTGEPVTEDSAERCANGCDDDRDGEADCEDFDCCEILGEACAAGTACADDA